MLSESVPKMSHEAKEKRLAWLQVFDFLDGAAGDRTPDLMTASHALSHLSYSPNARVRRHQGYRSHRRLSRAVQAAHLML